MKIKWEYKQTHLHWVQCLACIIWYMGVVVVVYCCCFYHHYYSLLLFFQRWKNDDCCSVRSVVLKIELASDLAGDIVKMHIIWPYLHCGWDLRICISIKFPGDASNDASHFLEPYFWFCRRESIFGGPKNSSRK